MQTSANNAQGKRGGRRDYDRRDVSAVFVNSASRDVSKNLWNPASSTTSPPKAPKNHYVLIKLQEKLETEQECRHRVEISYAAERNSRIVIEKQLETQTKAYLDAKATVQSAEEAHGQVQAALLREKEARLDLEKQITELRRCGPLLEKQLADIQAQCTQATAYYATVKIEAEDAVQTEREKYAQVQTLSEESLASKSRLEDRLEKETAERERLLQMLDVETLKRAQIERLLEAKEENELALGEERRVKGALEEQLARIRGQLEAERECSRRLNEALESERKGRMRLAKLLAQAKEECAAPFVVPAIMDKFALILADITDGV